MSKIYQALEKAGKEREMGLKKDFPPIPEPRMKREEQETVVESKIGEGKISNHMLVSFFQPGSLAAEQFRKLRSHLLRLDIPEPPKTIMVTSATNAEGKTFVAANLAVGIANEFYTHALLVDCDLRNPSLAGWFDLPKSKGLSDYLTGNGDPSELIMKTDLETLSVIAAGSIQDNPTELIGSKKMETLIQELKRKHNDRYIIFDSTPLLATTESEVLAKLVDGIILVVRAGVTPRETVQQAIRSLEKGKILGVVLNDLNFKSTALYARYFGSGSYYYRYGYGPRNSDHKGRWGKLFSSGRYRKKIKD